MESNVPTVEETSARAIDNKWVKFSIILFVIALVICVVFAVVYFSQRASTNDSKTDSSSSTTQETLDTSISVSKGGQVWTFKTSDSVDIEKSGSEEVKLTKGNSIVSISPSFNLALSWVNRIEVEALDNSMFMQNSSIYRVKTNDGSSSYVDIKNEGCIERYDQDANLFLKDTICVNNTISKFNLSITCESSDTQECDEIVKSLEINMEGSAHTLPVEIVEFETTTPYFRFRFPTDRALKTHSSKNEQPDLSLFAKEVSEGKPQEIAIYSAKAASPRSWIEDKQISDATYSVNSSPSTISINGYDFLVVDVGIMGIPAKQYVVSIDSQRVLIISEISPGEYADQDNALNVIINTFTTEQKSFIE